MNLPLTPNALAIDAMAASNPDLGTIKGRQQVAWSSGNYAIVGNTLQIVGETLCEAVDLRSTHRVLDVAAGSGTRLTELVRRTALSRQ